MEIVWLYVVTSYLFVFGVLIKCWTNDKVRFFDIIQLLYSPVTAPVIIGYKLS